MALFGVLTSRFPPAPPAPPPPSSLDPVTTLTSSSFASTVDSLPRERAGRALVAYTCTCEGGGEEEEKEGGAGVCLVVRVRAYVGSW